MSDSIKDKTRSSKLRQFPNESSYINKKVLSLKQTRKGYCSELIKTINKINKIIYENHNAEKIKVYDYQLDNIIYKIRNITAELHYCEIDETEKETILSFLQQTSNSSFRY